jgi:hypothetical protein
LILAKFPRHLDADDAESRVSIALANALARAEVRNLPALIRTLMKHEIARQTRLRGAENRLKQRLSASERVEPDGDRRIDAARLEKLWASVKSRARREFRKFAGRPWLPADTRHVLVPVPDGRQPAGNGLAPRKLLRGGRLVAVREKSDRGNFIELWSRIDMLQAPRDERADWRGERVLPPNDRELTIISLAAGNRPTLRLSRLSRLPPPAEFFAMVFAAERETIKKARRRFDGAHAMPMRRYLVDGSQVFEFVRPIRRSQRPQT